MGKGKTIKGHWRNIRVLAEVPVIEASYDRIKDWEMDPRGYFLIKVDREMSLIRVAFCALPGDVMQTEINLPFITADASGPKHLSMALSRSKLDQLVEDF